VILPLGFGTSFVPAIVGLAMFIGAILLPPAKTDTNADDKARELGAFVVINGGRFKLGEVSSFAARLFVGAEHISVLDSHFHSFLEIPVGEITSVCAEESTAAGFFASTGETGRLSLLIAVFSRASRARRCEHHFAA